MKVFIFLPDGVGLRNFAFTNFYKVGVDNEFEVVYWNNTKFSIEQPNIQVQTNTSHWLTDILKRTRKEIELLQFSKEFQDNTYLSYRFPKGYNTLKNAFKSCLVNLFTLLFNSKKGLILVRKFIEKFERKSNYYKAVKRQLEIDKPSFIFCTNQRPLNGIAPVLAAKDLKIPTATFIFSWDNLPKGTLVVETDYYFVWSNYMKKELEKYYPFIPSENIKITGTPQFEPHFEEIGTTSKKEFTEKYGIDFEKKYICFSGDDITTSPYDQYYLQDVVEAISELNNEGYNLGILFRKCPVDVTGRYQPIIKKYNNLIVPINPDWENFGTSWNEIMPTKKDYTKLINTINHSEVVINIGSSMVFDYACFNKPCIFINYNSHEVDTKKWNIKTIYKYIHFKSMPAKNSVLWVNSKDDIKKVILKALNQPSETVVNVQKWFDIIVGKKPTEASKNIWNQISQILN